MTNSLSTAKNPENELVAPAPAERRLFLTNYRSFQQTKQIIKNTKEKLRGKKFRIKKDKPAFCRAKKIALLNISEAIITDVKYTGIPCMSWTCPDCSIKKALQTKYLLRDVIQLNKLAYFLTLTLDPVKIPQEYKESTHKYITKIFNHFMTILKRNKINRSEEVLKYVWVVEFQKNGNAHLHILLNKFLPIRIVRKLWKHVGGGAQMKIEKVQTLIGISNYISDYIVKGIKGEFEEKPYGFKYFERRYSISKSCQRPQKISYERLTLIDEMTKYSGLDFSNVYNNLNNLGDEDELITI